MLVSFPLTIKLCDGLRSEILMSKTVDLNGVFTYFYQCFLAYKRINVLVRCMEILTE